MARLRATASAARSVLDGREHDGMLTRVGGRSTSHQNKIKKSANRQVKKRAHAHRLKFLDFRQHAAEYFEPEVFLVT